MTLSKHAPSAWILLVSVVLLSSACRAELRQDAGTAVEAPHTVCASTQVLAVDVTAATPRLPLGGGIARFTVTVTTLIDLDEAFIDIRVPAGVRKPAGYPRPVGLAVGEAHRHTFELTLPQGTARHDIVAGLRAVQGGVNLAQFNNAWVAVGNPVEPLPVLTRSGSSLVREVRFGDPLRRDGR